MQSVVRCVRPLVLIGIVGSLAAPRAAAAATFRSGGDIVVSADELIEDDLYAAGSSVEMNGIVTGDLIVAAGEVTVNGSVRGSIIAAGGDVRMRGAVGHAIRVAGGDVHLTTPVDGDIVVFAGELTLAPEASAGRDLVVRAGSATIAGAVGRELRVSGGEITLAGGVAGDAEIEARELDVQQGARVAGALTYRSPEARIAPGAQLASVRRLEPEGAAARVLGGIFAALAAYSMALVTGAALLWLLRRPTGAVTSTVRARPGRVAGWGVVALIAAPVLVVLLSLVVVGLPLALILAAAYVIGLYVGYIYAATAAGAWLIERLRRRAEPAPRFAALAVGLAVVGLLVLLPWIGWLVALAAAVIGLGGIVLAARGARPAVEPGEAHTPPPPRRPPLAREPAREQPST